MSLESSRNESLPSEEQLNAIARIIAEREGFDLIDPEEPLNVQDNKSGNQQDHLLRDTSGEDITENIQPTFQEGLNDFIRESNQGDEIDLSGLAARITVLNDEIQKHHQNVLDQSPFEKFQSLAINQKPLVDLSPEEVQHWIKVYQGEGNFEAAQILKDTYEAFVRELNQKAIEGHLFQQKQSTLDDLQTRFEWKQVEKTFLEKFPELKPFVPQVVRYLSQRFMSDPMTPYVNKYVLVRDAINALDLGTQLDSNQVSQKAFLPPDASTRARKIDGDRHARLDGKKTYSIQDIRSMDHRRLSDDDLSDLQNAMFEGRIAINDDGSF